MVYDRYVFSRLADVGNGFSVESKKELYCYDAGIKFTCAHRVSSTSMKDPNVLRTLTRAILKI
jgi:hypothetical protein